MGSHPARTIVGSAHSRARRAVVLIGHWVSGTDASWSGHAPTPRATGGHLRLVHSAPSTHVVAARPVPSALVARRPARGTAGPGRAGLGS